MKAAFLKSLVCILFGIGVLIDRANEERVQLGCGPPPLSSGNRHFHPRRGIKNGVNVPGFSGFTSKFWIKFQPRSDVFSQLFFELFFEYQK